MKHERSNPVSLAPRRRQAVEALRARLQRANWPRLQMSAITALTGASGFLASWLLLQLGVHRMALRYGLAVLAAYGVFLLLLRGWIHFHQRSLRRDLAGDVAALSTAAQVVSPDTLGFLGLTPFHAETLSAAAAEFAAASGIRASDVNRFGQSGWASLAFASNWSVLEWLLDHTEESVPAARLTPSEADL